MDYLINIGIVTLIMMISAQSYNLILGYGGMFHLGHIAFVAIGSYAMSILLTMGWPFWAALIVTMVVVGVAALVVGLPTLRLREDYLVIATLGFGLIVHKVAENWVSLTGGPYGIDAIPRPEVLGWSFNSEIGFFGFLVVVSLLIQAVIYKIVNSAFGRTVEAIREDEIAAQAIGVNTFKYRLQVLVIGAVFAGLAGAFAAQQYHIVTPRSYMLIEMIYIVIMVVIGGAGNFWGALVGAVFVNVVLEVFRFVPLPDHMVGALRVMFFATVLIVLMIWRPSGLMGKKIFGRNY